MNGCATPVDVGRLRIGPGTTDSEFLLGPASVGLPTTLAPGQAFTVDVQYRAQVRGMNISPLFVEVSGLASPLLVPLIVARCRVAETVGTVTSRRQAGRTPGPVPGSDDRIGVGHANAGWPRPGLGGAAALG